MEFCYPMIRRFTEQALWINCCGGIVRKKYDQEKTTLFYVGGVQGNAYFIPVDITEDVVKSVARKLSGSTGTGGTDLEALQGWLLKFWYDRKIHYISVEYE